MPAIQGHMPPHFGGGALSSPSFSPVRHDGADSQAVTMQPRFSKQIVAIISLSLTVVTAWNCSLENRARVAAIDCADWNSYEYFVAATTADVTYCLQSGAGPQGADRAWPNAPALGG